MEISEYVLNRVFKDGATLGAMEANKISGVIPAFITKQEACRRYTRAKVERWIKQGKLKKSKDDTWSIDPVMIEALNISLSPIYKSIKHAP
jgi:hypothetical protein